MEIKLTSENEKDLEAEEKRSWKTPNPNQNYSPVKVHWWGYKLHD
jgi:hypothetical protein